MNSASCFQSFRKALLAGATGLACLVSSAVEPASATDFKFLQVFGHNANEGYWPSGGLIMDAKGNLYGVTGAGGDRSCINVCGLVFELSPPATPDGKWTKTVLHIFSGSDLPCTPGSTLLLDAKGNLYGSGGDTCYGSVFKLSPPAAAGQPWTLGAWASFDSPGPVSSLIMDVQGNLYGTALYGGPNSCGPGWGCGLAFKLNAPDLSETVLHDFGATGADGAHPGSPLTMDGSGNLYGTTVSGGNASCGSTNGCGTVFELIPPLAAGGAWVKKTLLWFGGLGSEGQNPAGGLIFDSKGNLYGTAGGGGAYGYGLAFELSPPATAGENWTEKTLYSFGAESTNGQYPSPAALVMDAQGRLYGTTTSGGANGKGVAFVLRPPANPSAEWTEKVLHDFGGPGVYAQGTYTGLMLDASHHLFGVTMLGGPTVCELDFTCGTVYELTP